LNGANTIAGGSGAGSKSWKWQAFIATFLIFQTGLRWAKYENRFVRHLYRQNDIADFAIRHVE